MNLRISITPIEISKICIPRALTKNLFHGPSFRFWICCPDSSPASSKNRSSLKLKAKLQLQQQIAEEAFICHRIWPARAGSDQSSRTNKCIDKQQKGCNCSSTKKKKSTPGNGHSGWQWRWLNGFPISAGCWPTVGCGMVGGGHGGQLWAAVTASSTCPCLCPCCCHGHFAADIYLYLFYFYIYTGIHVCLSVCLSVCCSVCLQRQLLPAKERGLVLRGLGVRFWGVTSAMHFLAELK